ncbi:hypothetical protein AC1031_011368 [Aphanomyces cochlioides]|nr:hypothetical protein AC1031_011368 [Aphanomyces cochlioides]
MSTHRRILHFRSLPTVIIVKVAFFLPKWTAVTKYIEALRPADLLGPLEHLWQLHLLGWGDDALWPCLNITGRNKNSRVHVEAIASYYSRLGVDAKTDVDWFRCYADPAAKVWMTATCRTGFDMTVFSKWKQTRIFWFDLTVLKPDQFLEALSYLQHLEMIYWPHCTPELTMALCQYAASSLSLVDLIMETESHGNDHCTITTSMTDYLLKWIEARPINLFSLENFSWENQRLRCAVVEAALKQEMLKNFTLQETNETNYRFRADYDTEKRQLTLDFLDAIPDLDLLINFDNLSCLTNIFRILIQANVQKLCLTNLQEVDFEPIWMIVAPLLEYSQVEVLEINHKVYSYYDAIQIAQTMHFCMTFQEFLLRDKPASLAENLTVVNQIILQMRRTCIVPLPEELKVLETLVKKMAITLVHC